MSVYFAQRRRRGLIPDAEVKQTAIRLSKSLVKRIANLAKQMSKGSIPVTRTDVHRLILERGIDQLEQGVKLAGKKR